VWDLRVSISNKFADDADTDTNGLKPLLKKPGNSALEPGRSQFISHFLYLQLFDTGVAIFTSLKLSLLVCK
jgi:hypothetical protein